jgi:hypothetical protein
MTTPSTSQSIDWYHEGETRIIRVADIAIVIRFVGRKGRRGRIAVEAPAGAVFQSLDESEQLSPRPGNRRWQ